MIEKIIGRAGRSPAFCPSSWASGLIVSGPIVSEPCPSCSTESRHSPGSSPSTTNRPSSPVVALPVEVVRSSTSPSASSWTATIRAPLSGWPLSRSVTCPETSASDRTRSCSTAALPSGTVNRTLVPTSPGFDATGITAARYSPAPASRTSKLPSGPVCVEARSCTVLVASVLTKKTRDSTGEPPRRTTPLTVIAAPPPAGKFSTAVRASSTLTDCICILLIISAWAAPSSSPPPRGVGMLTTM